MSKLKPWTILEEEDVSPSPWFPLLRHTVQLPSGMIMDDYYLAPLGDVVMVLALTAKSEVVLVRQYKHGLGQILLDLPGGLEQPGKGILGSAMAELEEETGIKVDAGQLISLGKITVNPTKTKQVVYGFIVFNAEFNSVQKPDPAEEIEVVTCPAIEVLQKVKDGDIWTTDSVNFILKAALLYPDIFGL
ncbi:NUDIX hydrolase [Mucilaginibacter sp. HMF5004]|uniref:NUDIX hydrolase n=1 Tax=Mucilaginibacter rivuli TaxID=2857527 RepID=UPI001C606452|nr:NUDIX hydrolase [Mucilaginibacter rivuli]MBW4890640.1 NUDIX hydrolase [Mucilaginibacter rivuli]